MSTPKELLPKSGLLFQEASLAPVLCKPKLLPLKSVTLEKLDKMQKDAQQKMWKLQMEEAEEPATPEEAESEQDQPETAAPGHTDVWTADDDQ